MRIVVQKQWYDKGWLVTLLCLVLYPAGIYGVWKNRQMGKMWKLIISLFAPIFLLLNAAIPILIYVAFESPAQSYYEKGLDFQIAGNFKAAREEFGKGMEADPEHRDTYIHYAHSLRLVGEDSLAIIYYTKSIDASLSEGKYKVDAYYFRGVLEQGIGSKASRQRAIADYSRVIALDPDYSGIYYMRGLVKSAGGDNKSALLDFNKALTKQPGNKNIYFSRGLSKITLKDVDGAVSDLSKAIKIDSNYADAYYFRGVTLLRNNEDANCGCGCDDVLKAIELGYQAESWARSRCDSDHGLDWF